MVKIIELDQIPRAVRDEQFPFLVFAENASGDEYRVRMAFDGRQITSIQVRVNRDGHLKPGEFGDRVRAFYAAEAARLVAAGLPAGYSQVFFTYAAEDKVERLSPTEHMVDDAEARFPGLTKP